MMTHAGDTGGFHPQGQPQPEAHRFREGFKKLQQQLEGYGVLRVGAGAGGLVLALGCAMGLLNLQDVLKYPTRLLLRVYTGLFGIVAFLNECKSGNHASLEKWRQWSFKWFPFSSVAGGKGIFLMYIGTITSAFYSDWLVFGPGIALFLLGTIYVINHIVEKREMDEGIRKSYIMHANNVYQPLCNNAH